MGYQKTILLMVGALMPLMLLAQGGTHQKHECIDLGLPSGTLWATMNVGASAPEQLGSYFAWGETKPKKDYSWDTYKYSIKDNSRLTYKDQMTKYCSDEKYGKVDNKLELEEADDAATQNWGKGWRMPTKKQMEELTEKCEWKKTTLSNGKQVFRLTGPNGKVLILPCGGYALGTGYANKNDPAWSFYWSRNLYTYIGNESAEAMTNGGVKYPSRRYLGHLVRAVQVSTPPAVSEIDTDIKAETEVLKELFPKETKNEWAEKVNEARKLMFCPEPNYDKAIILLTESAEHGDTNAMWMLAQIYLEGNHTTRNMDKAWEYAVNSNTAGNPIGTYWLSVLYNKNEGSNNNDRLENIETAKSLYDQARRQLLHEANGEQTEGLKRDYTVLFKADIWETLGRMVEIYADNEQMASYTKRFFTNAANEGSCYAQRRMGDWCLTNSFESHYNIFDKKVNSNTIPDIPSYAQAMSFYQKAADQGDAEAQNILGVLIIQKSIALNEETEVATKDNYYLKEAFRNFTYSASQRNPDAFFNLAYCYEHSYGCEKNIERAKLYYQNAANAGSKKAKERLKALQKE